MKYKNLRDFIERNQKRTLNIKVMSHDGSSFWYAGSVANALEDIEKINQAQKAKNITALKQFETRLKNLDKTYENREKDIKRKFFKNADKMISELSRKKAQEHALLVRSIEKAKECVKIPLLDREIVETYQGILEEEAPCIIIHVKGIERGAYWFISEYEQKTKITRGKRKEKEL